jgi:hypothetical protein
MVRRAREAAEEEAEQWLLQQLQLAQAEIDKVGKPLTPLIIIASHLWMASER